MKEMKKFVALLLAMMMMGVMSLTAFAATQQYYFYTDAAATSASYMGHGCISSYDVNANGTVTLHMASETYTRNGVTYMGYISSLTANGTSNANLTPGSDFTFTPAGQVTPVTFVITMVDVEDPETIVKHPAINGYLKLENIQ